MTDLASRYADVPLTSLAGSAWITNDGPDFASDDPRTGMARPPRRLASAAQLDAAVTAANAVQGDWSTTPRAVRYDFLQRLTALVERDSEALAALIAREIGAPLDFARAQQVGGGIAHLHAFLSTREVPSDETTAGPEHRVRHEPLGVAGLITPWNWPLNQVVLKLGGALLAGCATVIKPSELTPLTALHLGALCQEAGLPDGVVNIVTGDGAVGARLVADERVAVVSFTGSTRAGRAVAAAAGLRPTILELGGKSPNLLFADCDVEVAVRQGVAHCFRNGGQSCNAASWMLVERSIHDEVVARAAHEAGLYTEDGPYEIGPLISAKQMARVEGLVRDAVRAGAMIASGGPGAARARGFYPRPTILTGMAADADILREEVFGPVLCILPFDTEAEAVRLANGTPYGLAAYLQTADPVRADRVACALRAGMVQVNGTSRAPGAPFGGVDASGHGREAGLAGIRAFQYTKSISGAARAAPHPRGSAPPHR